ncbi:MAG: RluA family pseudouridine synthase [Patescibacteria group bacterium]
MIKLIVDNPENKLRCDAYIAKQDTNLSRSMLKQLFYDQKIKVNDKICKPKTIVSGGDKIEINFEFPKLVHPPDDSLEIIFEDQDCVVIDKPSGMLTHSKGNYNPEHTVASLLRAKINQELTGNRAGIVHRLDRGTSGVMIVAKNSNSLNWLQKQFSQRKVKKVYSAIVKGNIEPKQAIIDIPLARDPNNPKKFRADHHGKPSQTEYHLSNEKDDTSYLELIPKTGRTHQIRVHLAHIGHPILGDELYGGPKGDRLYLHASSLELTLLGGNRQVFKSQLPTNWDRV